MMEAQLTHFFPPFQHVLSERRSLSDSTCWDGGKKWVNLIICARSPPQGGPPSPDAGYLAAHPREWAEYQKDYGDLHWDPHRDLPIDLPKDWHQVTTRYRSIFVTIVYM